MGWAVWILLSLSWFIAAFFGIHLVRWLHYWRRVSLEQHNGYNMDEAGWLGSFRISGDWNFGVVFLWNNTMVGLGSLETDVFRLYILQIFYCQHQWLLEVVISSGWCKLMFYYETHTILFGIGVHHDTSPDPVLWCGPNKITSMNLRHIYEYLSWGCHAAK